MFVRFQAAWSISRSIDWYVAPLLGWMIGWSVGWLARLFKLLGSSSLLGWLLDVWLVGALVLVIWFA